MIEVTLGRPLIESVIVQNFDTRFVKARDLLNQLPFIPGEVSGNSASGP